MKKMVYELVNEVRTENEKPRMVETFEKKQLLLQLVHLFEHKLAIVLIQIQALKTLFFSFF